MAEPTKGLRVEVAVDEEDRDHGDIFFISTKAGQYAAGAYMSTPAQRTQAGIDATYINWLIETDERRREQLAKRAAAPGDLLVDMGDLAGTEGKFSAIVKELDTVENQAYESMVEDYISGFNHVVIQGISPLMALYGLSQALGIALGFALRANMPFPIAKMLLAQLTKTATASERMVRVITGPPGNA